jgi:hypothetical protein
MSEADIIDYKGRKQIYNYFMLLLVLSTWMRLIGIMFVI